MAVSKDAKFTEDVVELLRNARGLGVRAGPDHRYTAVWVVVVDDRVFVRSWNDKPTGWFRSFRKQPSGMIQAGKLEINVRAKFTRGERLRHAVTVAFDEKYNTKGSRQWVEGFAEPEREATTLEFIPV